MACPFCTLKEINERVIIENDLAKAFLTNIPIVPGHTLVVPKRCVAKFEDLTEQERKAIFDLINKVKVSLTKSFGAEGFNQAWNESPVAGQSVSHFHLHILPRKEGDTGIYEYEPRKFIYRPGSRNDSPQEELLEVTKIIKNNL